MKSIVAVFGFLFYVGVSVAENFIDSIIPPLPDGWKERNGACITDRFDYKSICDFSIGVLEKNGRQIIYLAKAAPRIDPKNPRWLVTDQMLYPIAPTGFTVVNSICQKHGKPDETIIAVVKITKSEWFTKVTQAYKANLSSGIFEKTSNQGIRCLNESWGL